MFVLAAQEGGGPDAEAWTRIDASSWIQERGRINGGPGGRGPILPLHCFSFVVSSYDEVGAASNQG